MSAKGQTIALGLTLVFGIAVGVHSGPVPETRFIKGPTVYRTHVVTETETVHAPMPDSCVKAVELSKDMLAQFGPVAGQTKTMGKISLALQEFGRAVGNHEVQAANDAIEVIRAEKNKYDLAVLDALETQEEFDSWYKQCQQDAVVS